MDEPKQKQDTSGKQDSSVAGKETPKVETLTFTKEMVDKAVSDALSKAGRTAKTLSEGEQKLNAGMADLAARQVAWQKEKDEAEEKAIPSDDFQALNDLRERRRKAAEDKTKATEFAEEKRRFDEEKAIHSERLMQLDMLDRTQLAAEVAVERGVSIDGILKGSKLAKDYSRETMVSIAELLPPAKESPTIVSDSGRTTRGGIDFDNLSPREKIEMGLAKKK